MAQTKQFYFIIDTIRNICGSYRRYVFVFLLSLLLPFVADAQQKNDDADEEEIGVTLEVKGIGTTEIPAIIRDKDVFLSVTNVFDFIKIRNTPSTNYDSVKGFYINPQDAYSISWTHNRITFRDKAYDLPTGDLILRETALYVNLKYFKSVFGLDGRFNFRQLYVLMVSDAELPALREARLETMRKNVNKLKGELKADTVIKRSYPLFHFGTADWAVISTQQSQANDETRLNLGLGGVVAGGETNVSLNYYSDQQFNEKQQYYQWRFVNNDNAALRQVVAGKIYTQSVASLYAPLVGVQINNIPTIQRRSYGTYTISNSTEPGWVVELYVNDVLVDYKKTDASGFYTFDVPLIYGYSIIKLRFYGPYGEERTSQQYISVPFNFVPAREFEYSATGGIIEDGLTSKFGRLSTHYGLSNHVTVGAGYEYLSSVKSGPGMPFVNTSFRLASNLMLSGEYTHGVRSKGILSYRLPSNVQFDIDYTKFVKGQTAIFFNYLEDRKASVTVPLHVFKTSVFSRVAMDQIILPTSKYTNAELTFAGSIRRVGINLSSYASVTSVSGIYAYSLASLSFLVVPKLYFTSQLQYDYRRSRTDFVKLTLEKHLMGKGFVNLTYQEYFVSNNRNVLLGLRYDFSFARTNVTALAGNNGNYSIVESASGSVLFDGKTKYAKPNSRANIGKGAIVVRPFLDVNCNGVWDKDEPKAAGLKIRMNGGKIVYDTKDTSVRVLELEPYVNYYIELDRNSFDNISWQVKKKTVQVSVNANDFTEVDVPVAVVGEVSGTISLKNMETGKVKGIGQVIVNVYGSDGSVVARTITEPDGYFSYLGLSPGTYTAGVDPAQMQKLHYTSDKSKTAFRINAGRDGDVVDNIEFLLITDGKKR